MPRLISIELGRIFVLSQVHSKRNFVFGELAPTPNQVVVLGRITDEVDVGIGWRIH